MYFRMRRYVLKDRITPITEGNVLTNGDIMLTKRYIVKGFNILPCTNMAMLRRSMNFHRSSMNVPMTCHGPDMAPKKVSWQCHGIPMNFHDTK